MPMSARGQALWKCSRLSRIVLTRLRMMPSHTFICVVLLASCSFAECSSMS